jgi:hypothetical protein
MPALPLGDAGPYVAAAYLVFLALVLIYVAIMAAKLARIQREIGELAELAERRDEAAGSGDPSERARNGGDSAAGTQAARPAGSGDGHEPSGAGVSP